MGEDSEAVRAFNGVLRVLKSGFCSFSVDGFGFMISSVDFGDSICGCLEAYRRVVGGEEPVEFTLDVACGDLLMKVWISKNAVRCVRAVRRAFLRRFVSVLSSLGDGVQ